MHPFICCRSCRLHASESRHIMSISEAALWTREVVFEVMDAGDIPAYLALIDTAAGV